jgi:hypothetical protein
LNESPNQPKMKSLHSSVSLAASCESIRVPSTLLAALLGFGKNSPQVPLAADSRRCTLPIAADSCHNTAFPPAPVGGNRQLSAAIGGEIEFSKDTWFRLSGLFSSVGITWHQLASASIR